MSEVSGRGRLTAVLWASAWLEGDISEKVVEECPSTDQLLEGNYKKKINQYGWQIHGQALGLRALALEPPWFISLEALFVDAFIR